MKKGKQKRLSPSASLFDVHRLKTYHRTGDIPSTSSASHWSWPSRQMMLICLFCILNAYVLIAQSPLLCEGHTGGHAAGCVALNCGLWMLLKYSHFHRSRCGHDWQGQCKKTCCRREGERTVLTKYKRSNKNEGGSPFSSVCKTVWTYPPHQFPPVNKHSIKEYCTEINCFNLQEQGLFMGLQCTRPGPALAYTTSSPTH